MPETTDDVIREAARAAARAKVAPIFAEELEAELARLSGAPVAVATTAPVAKPAKRAAKAAQKKPARSPRAPRHGTSAEQVLAAVTPIPASLGDIAKATGIGKSTLTQALGKLVADGKVTRSGARGSSRYACKP